MKKKVLYRIKIQRLLLVSASLQIAYLGDFEC